MYHTGRYAKPDKLWERRNIAQEQFVYPAVSKPIKKRKTSDCTGGESNYYEYDRLYVILFDPRFIYDNWFDSTQFQFQFMDRHNEHQSQ